MMSGEAWLFLLSVLINAVNLFLQVFFTIMYSDLEWCVYISSAPFSNPLLSLDMEWAGAFLSLAADLEAGMVIFSGI
jgi:hypothetical protein